ncbi:MAG: hypothetical protein PHQ36_13035 [Anaerolineales bacterium]|nr:hypothetical protein [Anaerolineales bacterium]
MTITSQLQSLRGEMKKSRFKIWLRAFLFILFTIIFCVYFFRDIDHGYFTWGRVALVILAFIPIGFLMSLIVPMKADPEIQAVTFSLDRVYLFLIWLLVIAKLIMGRVPPLIPDADFIMAAIIGIMFGRLNGIGMRVRRLKLQHGFIGK